MFLLSRNRLTGNSQYGQQQDAYQGPPQQQGYPPQQQQYPGQQGYPGQQQGYGKNLMVQAVIRDNTERSSYVIPSWFYCIERPGLCKKAVCSQFQWNKTRKCREQHLFGGRSVGKMGQSGCTES